jgi:hypothetical protein
MKRLLAFLVSFLLGAGSALAQSGETINQLSAGAALQGTEQIPMYQGSNPAVTTTSATVSAYANGQVVYHANQMGVDCTGATDSASALQTAINTVPNGGTLLFPPGCIILLGSTVSITDRDGFQMAAYNPLFNNGDSGTVPQFVWNGTGGIMFDIEHSDHPSIIGFSFTVNAGKSIGTFLNFDGAPPPGSHIGTAGIVNYDTFSLSASSANPTPVAVSIAATTGSNHENYRITNSNFNCGAASTATQISTSGVLALGSPNLSVSSGTPFSSGQVGSPIWVAYPISSATPFPSGNGLVFTTIKTFTDSSHVVLNANAADNVTGAQIKIGQAYGTGIYLGPGGNDLAERFLDNTFFGCHYGIYAAGGSFQVTHYGGGYGDWGIYANGGAENDEVDFYEAENDQRAIEFTNAPMATITNTRMTNVNQLADGFIKLAGNVNIISSISAFGAPPAGGVLIGNENNVGTRITSIGNEFVLTRAQVGYPLFTNQPVNSVGDIFSSPGPITSFGCYQNVGPGGTPVAPCVSVMGGLGLGATTVSALPSCAAGTAGMMMYVTDAASSPVYGATATGGGSVAEPVFCNGTNWTNH